jgi:hypothetical protein
MKERPILFNAEMVRAILSGRKTQTRRVIKLPLIDKNMGCELAGNELAGEVAANDYRNCPLGQPGDQLWVREAFRMAKSLDSHSPNVVAELSLNAGYKTPWAPIQLEADGARAGKWTGFDTPPAVTEPGKLRPSLHMPRWASRIDLLITSVRVERLNDISEEDAKAEGASTAVWFAKHGVPEEDWETLTPGPNFPATHINGFAALWDSIYQNWQENPWVWVIEFELINNSGVKKLN